MSGLQVQQATGSLDTMQWSVPPAAYSELAAAFLQAAITVSLAALCGLLWRRYRKAAFAIWAVAWLLYSLRLGAIISFLLTRTPAWLFWHQVITGWTALALLWAALAFAQRVRWRNAYLFFVLFPVLWSYLAIYRLDNFLLAAGPAVGFLSGATLLTAWTFWRHSRAIGSAAAAFLAVALLLWGLHHLDYPFLRAQGVWNPWGYYLDTVFVLAMGVGILLLVQEDLSRGLRVLSALSAVLQRGDHEGDLVDELLARLLTLAAVRGSAMVLLGEPGRSGRVARGVGACSDWEGRALPEDAESAVSTAIETEQPRVLRGTTGARGEPGYAYVAALPVLHGRTVRGTIVVVGEARDPFAALDRQFLLALGQQVGAALANDELYRGLATRTAALERLAARMVRQHEEERRRLSRELHDETAQVLAAVNMQLGLARELATPAVEPPLQRALALVHEGIRSIRRVTEDLRPPLLDDLGLLPALRALVDHFREQYAPEFRFDLPESLPPLHEETELALFRSLQEALTNVARHASARTVDVVLAASNGSVQLRVSDDGRGVSADALAAAAESGRMGIVGMHERIAALGGSVLVAGREGGGAEVRVILPITPPRT
jgi:signal transduction histidine kinase